ncbi:MAG: hypothetical protein ABJG88_06265 [Litorimonas sp.]
MNLTVRSFIDSYEIMMRYRYVFVRIISPLFFILIVQWLFPNYAFAKSGIFINEHEVIINVTNGMPVLKAKIGHKTYNFLITPSDRGITISPKIAATFQLDENSTFGAIINLDIAKYRTKKNKLKIHFRGVSEQSYDVEWLPVDPYEGYDGTVGLSIFNGKAVTFIFNDDLLHTNMRVKSYRNNVTDFRNGWRHKLAHYIGNEDLELAFRPHYDVSRLTIGASYAFEDHQNLSFVGEIYYMPREYRGYQEFIEASFRTPISPLSSVKPLDRAEVHVVAGSRDNVVTEEDVVIATGQSQKVYSRILWLGLDYFQDCYKIVLSEAGQNLTTHCPDASG